MFLEVTLADEPRGLKKTLNLMQIASIEPFQSGTKIIMHYGGGNVLFAQEKYEDLTKLIADEGLLIKLS